MPWVQRAPRAMVQPPVPAHELVAGFERQARADFEWTCVHLLKIKAEDRPLAPLALIDTQRYLHERFARPAWEEGVPLALVILKSRRARVSTFWEAWFFHKVRWYPGQHVLIAAHLDTSVNALYDMVQRFHQYLPKELQPPTKKLNRKELAYEGLESSISVAAARYMDISRGQLVNHCHLAEAPYLPDPETIMSGLGESVPRRGRSSIILEGTANGAGTWFHQFWKDIGRQKSRMVLGGRRWQRCFIPWFAHPDYWYPVPKGFELTAEERERQRQFKLRTEQLVWYRAVLDEYERTHPGRGQALMSQENAETPEEAFLTSGSVVFPADMLDRLQGQQETPTLGFRFERAGAWQWELRACRVREATVEVWEEPKPEYEYAIGVDVAAGTGRHESTIIVVRMPGFVQVCEWGDNETSPGDLAGMVACVARYYACDGASRHLPIVNVDVTGGWGMDTNSRLSDFYSGEPFQMYIWEVFDRLAPAPVKGSSRTGWLFTFVSKNILISTAINLMREGLCVIPSQTIQEDLRSLQEEHLAREVAVEMTGADRAVGWLLAIVAAWRKIARWSWPVGGKTLGPHPVDEIPERDVLYQARYDTTNASLYHAAAGSRVGSTAGDPEVNWLIQG